jgi:transcriptional/translational regulatory protein YebC/TACO1
VEVYARVEDFRRVKEALEREGFSLMTAELAMLPTSMLQLDDGATLQVMRMMAKIEELEDVQQVYTNIDISDEVMTRYEAEGG